MTIEYYLTDLNLRMIYEKGYNDALNGKERSAIYTVFISSREKRAAYTEGYKDGLQERQVRAFEKHGK